MTQVTNQGATVISGKDVTVLGLGPIDPSDGTVGTVVSFLGNWRKYDITLKKDQYNVAGSSSIAPATRPIAWLPGSVTLSGIVTTPSNFAAVFAGGGNQQLQFVDEASGGTYQLVCAMDELKVSGGEKDYTQDITLTVIGIPYFAPAGGSLAPMEL